ncbi:hypothetical protein FHL15_000955 [Xylaria flabelliformis]|uniref:Uncharacterized protein n=1 Tax=Xylaria flabelliformis TaxID=2512241 RepID=A0A553IDP1_9PEZI|nr:hypothetical protein FHL15_000955 [Xylaria flabelliformis]
MIDEKNLQPTTPNDARLAQSVERETLNLKVAAHLALHNSTPNTTSIWPLNFAETAPYITPFHERSVITSDIGNVAEWLKRSSPVVVVSQVAALGNRCSLARSGGLVMVAAAKDAKD